MTATREVPVNALPALRRALTPAWVRRFVQVLAAGVVLLPPALLVTPWQQTVHGEGRAVAYAPLDRRQAVEAPIDGRIVRWWVVEGSDVEQGDPLFEVTDNDPELLRRLEEQRQAAEARLQAAEAKVRSFQVQESAFLEAKRLSLAAAEQRVMMAGQRVRALHRAVDAAEIAHETARLNYERRAALRGEGLASVRDYELARLELQRTGADLDRSRAELEAASGEQQAQTAERERIDADFLARITTTEASRESAVSEAATARSGLLELEVRLARQQNQRVTAPTAGTVLRLMAGQGGEMVKAGDPVVVLIPRAGSLAVELWVDGNDMPLVSRGRKVRLQFEGWPAVQFSGWPSVAVGTFGGEVTLVDASDDGKGRFRLLIQPDPSQPAWPAHRFLRQGVQTRGWVLLEQVTLGFELWRKLNGFPPVVAPEEPGDGAAKSSSGKGRS